VVFGSWAWLAGLLGCAVVTAMSRLTSDALRDPLPSLDRALHSWERWDTLLYEQIARSGYRHDPGTAAFFPLYPLSIRAADAVLPGGTSVATFAVSTSACWAALVLLHRLVTPMLGERVARRTAGYLLAFPTGFFLVAGYNEALFIALSAGSLACMHRGHWWRAAGLASLAGATRTTGIFLVVAFGYEYLRQREFSLRRIRADLLAVTLAPLGLVAYAGYCWRTFGDPLSFQHAQAAWHRSGPTMPWTTIGWVVHGIARSPSLLDGPAIINVISLAAAALMVAALGLALVGRWRLGPDQVYLVLFSGLGSLVPLLYPLHGDYPLVSVWRYALECLPMFMLFAKWGARNRHVERLYLLTSLPAQALMVYTFTGGGFIA